MHYAVEAQPGEEGKNIIHRTSCINVSGRLYPLGEFPNYDSALARAKQLGFTHLNGCYWCCYWNFTPSAETEQSTGT